MPSVRFRGSHLWSLGSCSIFYSVLVLTCPCLLYLLQGQAGSLPQSTALPKDRISSRAQGSLRERGDRCLLAKGTQRNLPIPGMGWKPRAKLSALRAESPRLCWALSGHLGQQPGPAGPGKWLPIAVPHSSRGELSLRDKNPTAG